MKNLKFLTLFAIIVAISFASCDKDDPEIPNEEEVITTLVYTLTSTDQSNVVTFTFQDLDGDGGNAPTITTNGTLQSGTTYNGNLQLLNETENPAGNITDEVEAESEDHQFFYQTNVSGLQISYTDNDANNNPIGLNTSVIANEIGEGTLTITLRHMPDKFGVNVSNGDITNAGGETDIEVNFAVNVE